MQHEKDRVHSGHHHHSAPPVPAGGSGALKTKDPVCGMTVGTDSGHRSEYQSTSFHFCRAGCKKKFDAEPLRYMPTADQGAPVAAEAAPSPGTIYTCPMHPQIRQDHPGSCPICGMGLEPLMPSLDDDDNPEL